MLGVWGGVFCGKERERGKFRKKSLECALEGRGRMRGDSLGRVFGGTDMDEVNTRGIFMPVAKVARILTFFSRSSLSME